MASETPNQEIKRSRLEILAELTKNLPKKNLHDLAKHYQIPTYLGVSSERARKNKGWVGQTVERAAGLALSNAQSPDGFDCEVKTTSLIFKDRKWLPKETIKITQLNPKSILEETFETSILWKKLSRLVFVGVHHVSDTECYAVRLGAIDLLNPEWIQSIRNVWEDVQNNILSGDMIHFFNFGNSEELIQLRPVGDGKSWSTCPVTGEKFPARAFYATKILIERLLQTSEHDLLSL